MISGEAAFFMPENKKTGYKNRKKHGKRQKNEINSKIFFGKHNFWSVEILYLVYTTANIYIRLWPGNILEKKLKIFEISC